MKTAVIASVVAALSLGSAACSPAVSDEATTAPGGKTYRVYLLAGQSNMVGSGEIDALPPELVRKVSRVPIFHGRSSGMDYRKGGTGIWAPLRPGHGSGFESTGRKNVLFTRFGPEMAFAARMVAADPGRPIALIKYARGGTPIAAGFARQGSWAREGFFPTRPNHAAFAARTIRDALAARDIDGDGRQDRLVPAGIVWMQGEADAERTAAAAAYEENLASLVAYLRRELGDADLPVAIGQVAISPESPHAARFPHVGKVARAQAAYVATDRCAALVTAPQRFTFGEDGVHYSSAEYLVLGKEFADAMIALGKRCAPDSRAPARY